MKNFLVYKSSAGSGKTTTLVKEYLKLTLKNPSLFRKILAITFTNKAANEMKTRIVETLQTIIGGNCKNNDAIGQIMKEAGLDDTTVAEKAKELLFNIEHHYEDFSVSTIDSFVHKIVRTFAAELDLPQNFEVLIDETDFVPFIVEDVYKRVGHDRDFTKILTRFVLSKAEDEKSHNINETLEQFVKEQLKEQNYFSANALDKLTAEHFLTIINRISAKRAELKKEIVTKAKEALSVIKGAGLSFDDFTRKKSNGVVSFFTKAASFEKISDLTREGLKETTRKAFYDDTGWYNKSASPGSVDKIESVKAPLKDSFYAIASLAREYLTYSLIYNNIFQVALMREIRELIRLFNDRTQKVHISEFNKQIAKRIADEPVPFIYERIGVRYTHFMIDEFQDTSVLQWRNLLPLIHESLAGNHFNMIVGDAKQAIYRFRGGEVELFTHLPSLYGLENMEHLQDAERALKQHFVTEPLNKNYRSREEIIAFNNEFFEYAKMSLDEGLRSIYDGHRQYPFAGTPEGGLISLRLMNATNTAEYRLKKEQEILEIIREVHDTGYPYGKITVLSKKNSDAASIATFLLNHHIPVVSSESIKLTASPKVRFLVALLHYAAHPDNQVNNANVLHLFLKLLKRQDDFHALLLQNRDPEAVFRQKGFEFPSADNPLLSQVYEMTCELVRIFFGNESTDLFVRFFLDFVYESRNIHMGDIGLFLELWEEKREQLSIYLPEHADAVQLMTAHKAKGLKFGTVIVDLEYNESNSGRKKDQVWQKVNLPDLQPLTETLFDVNKQLLYIGKKEVYEREQAKKEMDFLNLVYVAFTRPVDALYAIGRAKKGAFGSYLEGFLKEKNLYREDQYRYDFGRFPQWKSEKKAGFPMVCLSSKPVESRPWDKVPAIAAPDRNPFVEKQLSETEYGNLFHELMAGLTDGSGLDARLRFMEHQGVTAPAVLEKLKDQAMKIVSNKALKDYFMPGTEVLTETELYNPETGKLLRPDRVVLDDSSVTVIDYKTGTPESAHKKQILEYGRYFQKVGYAVRALLLIYVGEQVDVVEVA